MAKAPHIDEYLLRKLAGEAAYGRGLDYADEETVRIQRADAGRVEAMVAGTHDYRVALRWNNGDLDGTCDCPVGQRDEFCKHQVATALQWSKDGAADPARSPRKSAKRTCGKPAEVETEGEILVRWLSGLEHGALRSLVVELAGRDRDSLRALVARARFACAPPQALRKAVGELIGRKRFLDYYASLAYARRLETLAESLDGLLARDAAAALELTDYALGRLFPIYAESDDSAGAIGEALHRLAELHAVAAKAARPESSAFARAWLKLCLADDWGILEDVDAYAETLGPKGLGLLEKQASTRLDALPAPSRGRSRDEHASERLTLQRLLEELARHGGDVDALLSRKEQALHHPWDWLELARLCDEHGRQRLATQWLERGLKTFPDDQRLLEALAQRHLDEGFPEEALPLYWRAFQQLPGEEQYLRLRDAAQAAGEWKAWRTRALAHAGRADQQYGTTPAERLVCLHLAEADIEAARRAAEDARLPLHVWARLGPALEADHPEAALRVYRTLVQGGAARTNKQGYREAVRWLERMRPLHRRLRTEAAFAAYLDALCETYRAKRSFVAMVQAMAAGD